MVKKIIFIFIILLINGITNTTLSNLILTIPQIAIVLFFIITKKIDKAVFWHFIFFITSYTYFGDSQDLQLISYNYAKFKLIGPISYSYIVAILLMLIVYKKYSLKVDKSNLFYQFYKMLLYFMLTGFGIGLMGLAFGNYYIEGFINYGSYVIIIFIHTLILLKVGNPQLKRKFYNIIGPILALAPIVNFIIRQFFPEMVDSTALSFFSIMLLPALLYQKRIGIYVLGLTVLFYDMITYGASGKGLILLVLISVFTFFLSFTRDVKKLHPVRARVIRVTMLSFIIAIPTIVVIISNTYGGSAFIVSKMHQVQTLVNFLFFRGGVDTVAASPYIRVTSLINILYEGIHNPFILLFGKGYGGYFQDHFQYFSHLNLYGGAFSDKAILTGHYYTGHDTMVTVPMFNGLIGLFLILKLVWKGIKLSKNNYLTLSVVPFLLLVFYFDTLIGVTGVLLLYVGDINLRNTVYENAEK